MLLAAIGLLTLRSVPQNAPITAPTPAFDNNTALQQHRIRGELQQALYLLDVSATQTGWTAQHHAQAGSLWRLMGDSTRALPHWEAAAALNPTPDLLRQLAQFHIEDGEWALAWARLGDLLALAPEDAWGIHHAGMLIAAYDPLRARDYLLRTASARNRYSNTAQRLLVAIGDDFSDPLIGSSVGAVLVSEEQWSLAENAFRYAVALNHPYAEGLAWVGFIRAQQGKDGTDWLRSAINIAPDDATVRYIEGLYARAIGDLDYSVAALLLAVSFDPLNPVFYAELGNTHRAMGNLTEAEYWLQTAVDISNDDPIVLDALDRFYASEAFLLPDEALALRNIQRPQSADDPIALSAKGWALHLIGRSAEGLALVQQALASVPDEPRVRYDYARILMETGRLDEALPILVDLANGDSLYASDAVTLLDILD